MSVVCWRLSEFDAHQQRLDSVASAIQSANGDATSAAGNNSAAYGILFGGMISGVLDALCGDFDQLTSDVTEAVAATSESIRTTKQSYQATEHGNQQGCMLIESFITAGPKAG